MVEHPVCGHEVADDRVNTSGPCSACLEAIEAEQFALPPHPVCECPTPAWSHRQGSPCGQCLKDIDREYGLVPDPAINRPLPSIEDFRKWRGPLMDATDWVDNNPARVAREPPPWVSAIRVWRQELLDITQNLEGRTELPPMPQRKDY